MKTISVLIWLTCQVLAGEAVHAQTPSGTTTWGPWRFDWNVGSHFEGLEISNVHYKDIKVAHKASLPVIRVKYGRGTFDGSGCGPYADRMAWHNMVPTPPTWVNCQNHKICQREWGGEILELGALSAIGEYDLYQAWYFTRSGRMEGHLFSRGWSCQQTHRHHPYWRIDFDVDGTRNEIYRFQKSAPNRVFPDDWREYRVERNEAQPTLQSSIGWWIANTTSRHYVIVRPNHSELSDLFSTKDVGVRLYRGSEDEGWYWGGIGGPGPTTGALRRLPYGNSESIWAGDSVFWFVGHLPHTWQTGVPEERQDPNWHEVGPLIYMGW